MGVFDQFPYTNFHELNLDYILQRVKELEAEVQELTQLLETGPVVDVKTRVNGASTSIKNGSGIANLPAADDTTAGVVNLDAVSDDVLRISGAENFNIPILDNGMISADQLPPTVGPATDAAFGTVKLDDSTNGIDITGADGTFTAAKLSRVPLLDANGDIDTSVLPASVPLLDANGDLDPTVIPASGVIAGTYGTYPGNADAQYMHPYGIEVGADGRISKIYQNPASFIRTDVATIAAGSVNQSIYFDTTNYPWYNNACFVNVNVFQQMTSSKGDTYLEALIPGTDYTWNIYAGYLNVRLKAAKTSPVYICVNGSFGERIM